MSVHYFGRKKNKSNPLTGAADDLDTVAVVVFFDDDPHGGCSGLPKWDDVVNGGERLRMLAYMYRI